MLVLSTKPLQKLTGTDRQAGGQAGAQDYVLSQADALTKKWEHCDIPVCNHDHLDPRELGAECEKKGWESADYRGTVSTTVNGKKCQSWFSITPHNHTEYDNKNAENNGIGNHNFCRKLEQPKNKKTTTGGLGLNQWCYTTDEEVTYEHCKVDICTHDTIDEGGLFKIWMKLIFILAEKQISMKKVEIAAWKARHHSTNKMSDCKAFPTAKTIKYQGKINTTKTGKPCMHWKDSKNKGYKGFIHNYCRTTKEIDNHVWCWTDIKSQKWDHCDVPLCKVFIKEYVENVAKVFNIEFD